MLPVGFHNPKSYIPGPKNASLHAITQGKSPVR
jgi:hypothetical protein